METKRKSAKVAVSLLALAGLLLFSLFAVGGSLEPSAPPGSTMKTLDEVEPRIPIPGSATPTYSLTIRSAGSYYLTGNRNAETNGILIEANDVTIDLMGYTLRGSDSRTGYSGISMNGCTNVEIRNGTVRDFHWGIREQSTDGKQHRVINVRAMSNGFRGIELDGYGHLVKDCTATENGNDGIYVGNDGLYVGSGCTVTGNTACNNGESARGPAVYGICPGSGSTVTSNTAYYNGTSATGDVYGIFLAGNSLVDQNTAYNNNGTNMNNPGTCTFGTNHAPL